MTEPWQPIRADEIPLHRTVQLGHFRLHIIDAGLIWLDGGAMFGVVPKPLWGKRIRPDGGNRIPLALRCVLVETPDGLVLVETGLGNKESEKFRDMYGVDNAPPAGYSGAERLQAGIIASGFDPKDIEIVVNTHLHFDHCGGNTLRQPDGVVELAFPKARYYVQRGEWEYAHRTNERTQASYFPGNYEPVFEAGKLNLVEGAREIFPGISVRRTPGHTPYHQSVVIRSGGETACFLADVIPTMSHLPLPWIMGYDVEPLVTLESKRALLREASAERWLLISTHDAVTPCGHISFDGARVDLEPTAF